MTMKSFGLVALTATMLTLGGNSLAASGGVNSKISRLYFFEGHSGLLVVLDSMTDLGGCGNANYYLLPNTHVHYNQIVALLLAAKARDATVGIHVDDCFQGYGRIKHASLEN